MQLSSFHLKLEFLSMSVDETNDSASDYRGRIGDQIKYLSVAPGTFQEDILREEVIFYVDWTNALEWNGYMEKKKGWHSRMDFGERKGLIPVRLVGLERIVRRCGSKRCRKGWLREYYIYITQV